MMRQQMAKSTLEAPSKVKQQLSQVNPPDTTIVASVEEAKKVMAKLLSLKEAGRFHAIDTEVRGWEPNFSPYLYGEVICWSIYCGDDVDFGNGPRIFIDNMDEDGNLRGLVEYFKPYLEDPDIPKVFQNFSFDRAMLLKHNCDVAGFAGDTMDMAHLDNSEAADGYSLEALGKRYLGNCWGKRNLSEFMKQEGVKGVAELHLHKDPKVRSQWIDYSTFDTLVTWKVHEELRRRLHSSKIRQIPSAEVNEGDAEFKTRKTGNLVNFYDQFWRPYAEVLCRIEERGVRIDRNLLKEKLKEAEVEFSEAREAFLQYVFQVWERLYPEHKDLHEARENFNPLSVLQMRYLLYGRGVQETKAGQAVGGLGLPPAKVGMVEESTSNEAILKLAGNNPAAGMSGCGEAFKHIGQEGCLGLSHRNEESKIGKAISFLTKLTDDNIADKDSRVHTSLRLSTRTGRLTSQHPNLQQLPAVEKDHYQIRSGVVPAPGKSFIIADYGQLDLRVLAHTAQCPDLSRALSTGTDLHSHTAVQMYPHLQKAIDAGEISLEGGDERPSLKDVYPGERRAAKAVNFGIAYGLTGTGLATQLNCRQDEANAMIEKWHDAYPQVEKWQSKNVRTAEMGDLTVRTYRGRPRHLFNLSKKPIREATPVAWSRTTGKQKATQKRTERTEEEKQRFREYYAAKRQANNSPVQGGSADLVAEAMVKAEWDPELKELGYVMVLQVHDELIFEGPEENAEKALNAVKRVMESPFLDDYKFSVPLVVDVKVANSWHEAKHA